MEEKKITSTELLNQINIWQTQGLSNDDIVRSLIADCLVSLGVLKIQEEKEVKKDVV
jgi:hypothetical protein